MERLHVGWNVQLCHHPSLLLPRKSKPSNLVYSKSILKDAQVVKLPQLILIILQYLKAWWSFSTSFNQPLSSGNEVTAWKKILPWYLKSTLFGIYYKLILISSQISLKIFTLFDLQIMRVMADDGRRLRSEILLLIVIQYRYSYNSSKHSALNESILLRLMCLNLQILESAVLWKPTSS